MCSEKNSFDNKSNLNSSPNDNIFKGQMEKISLNDSGDDFVKSINIGRNKNVNNNKEYLKVNQEKNNNNLNSNSGNNNKSLKRDSNVIENLHDTSLELEEGIEKKD